MNNVEFLKAVRAIIEKGWTQRVFARDAQGKPVSSGSKEAVSHCVVGAARAVGDIARLHSIMWRDIYNIPEWNDDPRRTKGEVLAMLDKFIEKER